MKLKCLIVSIIITITVISQNSFAILTSVPVATIVTDTDNINPKVITKNEKDKERIITRSILGYERNFETKNKYIKECEAEVKHECRGRIGRIPLTDSAGMVLHNHYDGSALYEYYSYGDGGGAEGVDKQKFLDDYRYCYFPGGGIWMSPDRRKNEVARCVGNHVTLDPSLRGIEHLKMSKNVITVAYGIKNYSPAYGVQPSFYSDFDAGSIVPFYYRDQWKPGFKPTLNEFGIEHTAEFQPTIAQIKAELNSLKKYRNKKSILFYYAGHGEVDPKTGQQYLFAYDTDPNDLKDTAINVADLYRYISKFHGKRKNVVIIDACYISGPGGYSPYVALRGLRNQYKDSKKVIPILKNTIVLTATSGPDQIALVNHDVQSGEFTFALGMDLLFNKPGTEKFKKELIDEVENYAKKFGVVQIPTVEW